MVRQLTTIALLLAALPAFADEPKSPVLTPEEMKLAKEAAHLNREGVQLYQQGKSAPAIEKLRESLDLVRRLYPATRYPDGHTILARSLNNMGAVLSLMGQSEKALPYYQQSLDMTKKLFSAERYPDGHLDLAISLNNMGQVLESMGQSEKALTIYRQSLDMRRRLFPATKYPDGHIDLATGLNSMGSVLESMGESEKALILYGQSLDMRRKLFPATNFPDGHADLAASLNSMGSVLESMGQLEKALTYYQQSMDIYQRLFPITEYPDGHPDLAISLNNMGHLLKSMGQSERALTFFQRSLDMYQKLFPISKYPNGHPSLARGLNNKGFMLHVMGQSGQALTFYKQSLEMYQKLYAITEYPHGHPSLARSLNNKGFMLHVMGQSEQALTFFKQSLDMYQLLFPIARYPDGHPQIAATLVNMGGVLSAIDHAEKALPYYEQSLEMQQRLLRRELATTSEEAAFDKATAEPLIRDAYLSATRGLHTPGAVTLRLLWPSRSMVTRLLEQRQANARAAGTELGVKLDELRGLRRRIDQILQGKGPKGDERDKLLVELADKREKLERELVEKIPALKHWQELDKLGPDDLVQVLPAGAVFVDVIRYTHFEYVNKKQKRTPSYVAFVVAKDGIRRIELKEAEPIDAAVRKWRAAIDQRGESPAAVADLARLAWEPMAKALPPGTTTLYLAADGDLARLPWAALPIARDRVVLEDYAIAQVPHGTFLLDQLKFGKKRDGVESLLAVGGIDYGAGVWPALPGTKIEMNATAALAAGERETASGLEATVARVSQMLPKARYVHLATHGEFKANELTAEKKRAVKAMEAQLRGDDSRKIAAKNPLGYVGLVLANGDVLSGLGIVDLPLKNTHLVTLSACETGLGELTGGEGVQGLQRAFHLAGCPNVVASLWKVNDEPTAALMRRFYYHLWEKKEPPIQALRLAELELYRNPNQVADLVRGNAPKFSGATKPLPKEVAPKDGERAATKLWAAFVLSGVGN